MTRPPDGAADTPSRAGPALAFAPQRCPMRATRFLGAFALALAWTGSAPADDDGPEFFESKIRPVLVERCNRCHSAGPKAPKGGLRLDSPEGIKAGGDTGPITVPGKADESPIIEAIEHGGGVAEMPPDSKLPDRAIADFRRWVEMGSPPALRVRRGRVGQGQGDRPRARPPVLVVPAGDRAADPDGLRPRLAPDPRRPLPAPGPRRSRDEARPRGRPPDPDPPGLTFDLTGLPPTLRGGPRPSSPTPPRTPSSGWSTGSSPRPATASAGPGTGSTSPGMPRTTRPARRPTRPRGTRTPIATGSSGRSTTTCPTTSSSAASSPPTSCPGLPPSELAATRLPRALAGLPQGAEALGRGDLDHRRPTSGTSGSTP